MHVKLRISRQTGSQINKEGPQQETRHREQPVEMDGSERDDHQPGRPESWELDKPGGPSRNPRGSATPALRLPAQREEISVVLGPTVCGHFQRLPHETPRVTKDRWEQ